MNRFSLIFLAVLILGLSACSGGAQSRVSSAGVDTASPSASAEATAADEADATAASSESSPSSLTHGEADMITAEDGVIEIGEKMFVTQTNEIYLNYEDYLGKTFRYEGLFFASYYEETDATYYYVARYGPGCCNYDSTAGFEVAWDGDYPEDNDWVQVVGTLETYDEDGYEYLQLRLSTLEVLEERGAEYVSQ